MKVVVGGKKYFPGGALTSGPSPVYCRNPICRTDGGPKWAGGQHNEFLCLKPIDRNYTAAITRQSSPTLLRTQAHNAAMNLGEITQDTNGRQVQTSRPRIRQGRIRTYNLRVMSANPESGTSDHHVALFAVTRWWTSQESLT